MKKNKKRLAGIDLLQIVSMIMIVGMHYLARGGVFEKLTVNDSNYYVAWLFEILSVAGVNCFILCTGYLLSEKRFSFSRMIYLWIQVVVTNIVCAAFGLMVGACKFSFIGLVKCFMPITSNSYWYMTALFIFYVLSPLFIWVANKLTETQLKKLVITLTVLFAVIPWQWTKIDKGFHFVWFGVLFFFAAYVKRAQLFKKRVRVYCGQYLLVVIVTVALKFVVDMLSKNIKAFDASRYIDVRNPDFILTLIASVLLFAAFKNLRIKKEKLVGFITFLSPLMLGVYLIHDNPYLKNWLWAKAIAPVNYIGKPYFAFHMIICVLAVFFFCSFFDYFRRLLFKLFGISELSKKLGAKAKDITDKVFKSDFIEKL